MFVVTLDRKSAVIVSFVDSS